MGRAIIALGAVLLLLPLAGAQPTEPGIYNPYQSTPTTMWFHINGFQDFPINTQPPSDKYAETVSVGLATHSGCVSTGEQHFTDTSHHTWYGYSSPSYVQYDVDENGKPRIHQERGISYDVEFDQATQPMFTWYLEGTAKSPVGDGAADAAHPPIPNVIVRATVREGDDVSVGNSAFNTGEIIARGESLPATLAGGATQGNEHVTQEQVNGKWIYKFQFPLEFQKGEIDKRQSFNIRVDAFIENDFCGDPGAEGGDYTMADYVLVHTSSEYRPQLKWNIMNPLYIEALHPQFVGDDLVVHTASNSPWGSYDVQGDLGNEQPMSLEVTGPSPALSLEQVALVQHSLGHGVDEHFKAVAATWIWDYQTDKAREGTYTVTFHIQNDQNSADAYAVATFNVGQSDGEVCGRNLGESELTCIKASEVNGSNNEESPGVPAVALLALLGAAAVVLRRRL